MPLASAWTASTTVDSVHYSRRMTPLQLNINADAIGLVHRAKGLKVHAGATTLGANGTALDALEWVFALRDDLAQLETLIVRQARVEGATWAEIAEPLGLTKQGAQKHWGVGTPEPEADRPDWTGQGLDLLGILD